ncbi:Glutamate dehydrogenase mitochondrial [Bienertia sinuspersici]
METFARTKRLIQRRIVQLGDEGPQDEGPQNQEPQDEGRHDDRLEDEGPSNYVQRSTPRRRSKCGNSVQLAGSRETSLEYNELVGVWLEHLGKDRSNITISDIVNKMKKQEETLVDYAREWKVADGTSLFTGPMLALLLSYMDRLCFMGHVMDRQFPLIKCWERANIFNRRDLELKKDGEYGIGDVKSRLILNVGGQHVRYQQEIPTETTEHAKKGLLF